MRTGRPLRGRGRSLRSEWQRESHLRTLLSWKKLLRSRNLERKRWTSMQSWLGDGPLQPGSSGGSFSVGIDRRQMRRDPERGICRIKEPRGETLLRPSGLIFAFRKVNFDKWRAAGT